MRTTVKHPKTDLSVMTEHESKHLRIRGHLRAFHGYVATEDDALAKLNRLHDEAHRNK
jgi:hypothetical protein